MRLTRLSDYGVMHADASNERVVLLGFAGLDEQGIEEGLRALARAWL